jgi:molybdopterin synthase sulfur carrier subunit
MSPPSTTRTPTVTIHVPGALRDRCGGAAQLSIAAATVQTALDEIECRHPSLWSGVCDETGRVRRHINVFVNTSHMRDLNGLSTSLAQGDEIIILPAVSGG